MLTIQPQVYGLEGYDEDLVGLMVNSDRADSTEANEPPFDETTLETYESTDTASENSYPWSEPSSINPTIPGQCCDYQMSTATCQVSIVRRLAQVVFGVVACWLASGIMFGFAALKPVLVAEGVYRHVCELDELSIDYIMNTMTRVPCPRQNLKLNVMFMVGSITCNTSSLLAGTILDRYGRRVCWLASCLLLTVGCVMMAISSSFAGFDGYIVAFFFLGLGGTFNFVPSFQLSRAFPQHSELIIALITGAFDASAAVFLFYRIAFEASDGWLSTTKFFYGYLIIPLLILAAELSFMPRDTYPEQRDCYGDENSDILSQASTQDGNTVCSVRLSHKKGTLNSCVVDAAILQEQTIRQQLASPWFILMALFTILQMIRMNYFISTIRGQYRYMLKSEESAKKINNFFDVALPVGGVALTPFIGLLLHYTTIPTTFAILTGFLIAVGIFNCLPYVWAAYATVIAFVVFRPLYYSALSAYAMKVFGLATFGRIYGTTICISGIINFIQPGLDALTDGPLHGNPLLINVVFGASGAVVGISLWGFTAMQGAAFSNENIILRNERQCLLGDAHERTIPRLDGIGESTLDSLVGSF